MRRERAEDMTQEERNKFVEDNQKLVYWCLRRYKGLPNFADYIQQGNVGMIIALDRCNNENITRSYLVKYITGYVKTYIRNNEHFIVTRYNHADMEILNYDGFNEGEYGSDISALGKYEDGFDETIVKCEIENILLQLNPRHQVMIRMLIAGYTEKEIAEHMSLTVQAVNLVKQRFKKDYKAI